MSTPQIVKFSETQEEKEYREKCIQEDKIKIDAYIAAYHERIKQYRAYTNDPFNPIYTKEVVAGFYEKEEPPQLSLFSQWPLKKEEPEPSCSMRIPTW